MPSSVKILIATVYGSLGFEGSHVPFYLECIIYDKTGILHQAYGTFSRQTCQHIRASIIRNRFSLPYGATLLILELNGPGFMFGL